ncbi:SDR family NAD(P)-dependent oxidoreductase [Actinoplanes flavus]|uniref:SDR family oxidoreductase n=1 Tax=Actinoplanes flavus TaxID=2820290 RepID=A0ABS3UVM7_9ACTN|nr:SDR family oxidoreductase [Actinoplanes flavus]MBO3742644.1 SDR family oxidoreductase [Actinoplanes flavus]
MGTYTGKKAVVIGGTHGMGRAVVDTLLADGAQVLLTGRTEVAAQPGLHAARSDVTSTRDIDALGETVAAHFGLFDFLHVNVGVAEVSPFERVTVASYDRMFDVNARGVFFTVQRLAPMIRDGGSIVFTTAVTNGLGSPTMSVYSGTKAAVRAFAKVLAAELLPRGVRVNTVAPGFIDTPTMGFADAGADERAALMKVGDQITPMRRHGTVREIARAVLFLGFEATFTTGVELPVDGGLGHVETRL